MTAITQLAVEGPYGNPNTTISDQQGLSLRKNATLEEAWDICQAVLDGKDVIHVARGTDDLMSYGVGAMLAKMAKSGLLDDINDAYLKLSGRYTRETLKGERAYRFNRRTVFNSLQQFGLLRETLSIREAKPAGTLPTITEIARIIENYEHINLAQIQSPARSREIVKARFYAIWVMRYVCGHSLTYIGEQLGNRDHTSILNGVNRVRAIRGTDSVSSEDAGSREIIDNICDECDMLALRRHHSILMSQSGIRRVA